MATPTAYEQYILELVNRARLDPLAEAARLGIDLNQGLSAGTLTGTAKQPLAFNPLLIDAARGHSEWMLATDTFSHTGAGGSSAGTRMTNAGYSFTGSWSWGENIAWRTGAISATMAETLHNQLFLSAGHRVNILNDTYREAGFGLAQGDYKGYPTVTMLTEDFARSGSSVFLVGVTFDDGDGDRFYDPGEGLGGVTLSIRNVSTGALTSTVTWSSGGYQLALAPGSYEVTFSGGGLAGPAVRAVTIGTSNVKLDLNADDVVAVAPPPPPPPPPPPTPTGDLVLAGTTKADMLVGGAGNDSMIARGGNDTLIGGDGADTLSGGAGKDILQGGAGNDVLIGGGGPDTITGGSGADRIVFEDFGKDRGDRITDFNAAEGDRVDIAAFLTGSHGTNWAALSASGHVKLTAVSGGTMLWVDQNGGGDAFYQVVTFEGRSAAQLGSDFLIG